MKDISVEDETGDIEVGEAHRSDDDVLQEDVIANEASSGTIEDANSAQMVADADAVSNENKIYEPVTEGEYMKDSDANINEVISDTLEDATGREDGVLQVDAIANKASSDDAIEASSNDGAIEDANSDQVNRRQKEKLWMLQMLMKRFLTVQKMQLVTLRLQRLTEAMMTCFKKTPLLMRYSYDNCHIKC